MRHITFLRRKGLGSGIRGPVAVMDGLPSTINGTTRISVKNYNGEKASIIRNDQDLSTIQARDGLLIRWGCTTPTGVPLDRQINKSSAIQTVNDKAGFRMKLQEIASETIPRSFTADSLEDWPRNADNSLKAVVVRPRTHAQGRNLAVVRSVDELDALTSRRGYYRGPWYYGWYAGELIDKVSECRVYVVNGKVATVANKVPDDYSRVAWNVAQGGRFDVIRWGDWPMEACRVAIEAFKHSGLDFGGVDVMMDAQGRAYVIEVNSAPTLPPLSDGSISYRQKCMAKCFMYLAEHGNAWHDTTAYGGWRDVIHPAVTGEIE